ncbi:MAG: hypothetical protein ABSH06_29920 [Thermodesulfobacteriota bacterium]|jgi:hypothetical protein
MDKSQAEAKAKVKAKVKAEVEENLEFFGLIAFIKLRDLFSLSRS